MTDKKTIYQKLVDAKKAFPDIVKDVSSFGYKYANLAQVIKAITQPLWDNGLDFYQSVKDNKMITGIVDIDSQERLDIVEFDIISASISKASDVQQYGGGITYMRRYSLMSAFNLATEDDDGKTAQHVAKPQAKAPITAKATPQSNTTGNPDFDKYIDLINDSKSPEQCTELISHIGADKALKHALHNHATNLGFVYDKDTNGYIKQ